MNKAYHGMLFTVLTLTLLLTACASATATPTALPTLVPVTVEPTVEPPTPTLIPVALAGPQAASTLKWIDTSVLAYVPAGDFKMGNGMNGLQFLGHIREAHWLEGVPVAMVTEPVKDSELVTCYRMGICSFLSKPVQGFELREAIRDFAQPAMELQAASIVRRSSSDWRYKSAA